MKNTIKRKIIIYVIITILILALEWNKLLFFMIPFFVISIYRSTDSFLKKVRTRIDRTTFEIAGLVVKSDMNITDERQKIVRKYVKILENSGMFIPYDGISKKEAEELGGVYYVDNIFKDIFTWFDEPENEYDPNAIRVELKNQGHIGYIPKERTEEFRNLLNDTLIDVECRIYGGKIKGKGNIHNVAFNCSITLVNKIEYTMENPKL